MAERVYSAQENRVINRAKLPNENRATALIGKVRGVKPQIDDAKLAACDALALYLASGEVQLARYGVVGWGPSNLAAQQAEVVKADKALAALGEQLGFCIPQGQYPNEYWQLATALGDDVMADKYDNMTDEQLMDVLVNFQATAGTYLTK